jgi:hypothetical protein
MFTFYTTRNTSWRPRTIKIYRVILISIQILARKCIEHGIVT